MIEVTERHRLAAKVLIGSAPPLVGPRDKLVRAVKEWNADVYALARRIAAIERMEWVLRATAEDNPDWAKQIHVLLADLDAEEPTDA